MTETITLQEIALTRNPSLLNYVYNQGDDYIFVKSFQRKPDGTFDVDYRHFDINRLPPQKMSATDFLKTFRNYSMKTHGLLGGRKTNGRRKSRRQKLGKKKTQKRKYF
jgi:hypothetical protein